MEDDQVSVISYFLHTAKVCEGLSGWVAQDEGDDRREGTLFGDILHFLDTIQSCLELKNFEAVFAIMEGLLSWEVQQLEIWQVCLA